MRIVGGSLKGQRLTPPADRRIRPTSDRARETLFNILAHAAWSGGPAALEGAVVLDAFCGTGALGLEALSRGAARAWFLDRAPGSVATTRDNVSRLGLTDRAAVLRADATRPPPASAAAGLVFLDPPYKSGLIGPTLVALTKRGWLAPGAVIVAEQAADEGLDLPPGFEVLDERRSGGARLRFLRFLPAG